MPKISALLLAASIVGLLALLMPLKVCAADIDYKTEGGVNFIRIVGRIVQGDAEKFRRIIAFLNGGTVVLLNSEGGLVIEGLDIGTTIRLRGYDTAVTNEAVCASTCGLIWLAGITRYAGNTARIGFHAAYSGSGDEARESGTGNALVGAYLTNLGLSPAAIIFVTSAPPSDLNWLHPNEAQRAGIALEILPDPIPTLKQQPSPSIAQEPPDGTTLERRMMNVVIAYYALW